MSIEATTALILVGLIFYIYLRNLRFKKIESRLIKKYKLKIDREITLISKNSKQDKNIFNKLKSDATADTIELIGGACYNYLSFSHAKSIIEESTYNLNNISDSIKDDLVFQAMDQRYSDFDTDGVIKMFNHHLNQENFTLLKGDVGEQVGAALRKSQGFEVEFPTGLDGSWKSNQEGHDYIARKGESFFKENPKVGYKENFSKIKEQAEEHPDVNYLMGDEHQENISKSGLDNIECHHDLSEDNILNKVFDFKNLSENYIAAKEDLLESNENLDNVVDDVSSGQEYMAIPWLSLAFTGFNQVNLIKKGDISTGEALSNTLAKTAIKTGAAKGGGFAGAQMGLMVGGPVGAIVGGALGAFYCSRLGGSVFVAWKSEVVMEIYSAQMKILEEITNNTIEDVNLKIKQTDIIKNNIRRWVWTRFWHILWPSEEYVIRKHTYTFLGNHKECLIVVQKSLKFDSFKVMKLKKQFSETGFFGRLLGDTQALEKGASVVTENIFLNIQKCGSVRVGILDSKVNEWKKGMEEINKEKRKLAA